MSRTPIRAMAPDLALKIAAGEVVERPSSVVRELLDNAIDAGARRVRIEVREAGLKRIRVTDDGQGIPAAELPLAFASHATSKVSTLDDLEHLTTLGFRGEALPSIAAVSRIEAQTHAAEEDNGCQIRLDFGEILSTGPSGAPPGTRISVSDLFANVPARRKFVRSLRAEGGQIQHVVQIYALAQPAIQFSLDMDGDETFHSPGTGSLTDAVAAVYGARTVDDTCVLDWNEAEIEVEGVISTPALSRPTRSGIHVFVNGRPVGNRSLAFALEEAYSGFLMTGRHPLAAIHLRLSPGEIDPNVHPSKSEVRFARDREVHGIVHRAVANALLELRLRDREIDMRASGPVPTSEPAPLPLSVDARNESASDEPRSLLPHLPAMRVFGQTNQAFIIAEGPGGLYMIDQHAAHERILFDQLDEQLDAGVIIAQPLLEPALVELEPEQMLALEINLDLLMQAGFELEPFGNGACLARAVPALSGRGSTAELVREVLDELRTIPEPAAARERALAVMACKGAVKAGQTLDVQEMRELLEQLERTPRPSTCPHGRPTMIHLSHTQLEREFGRR